MPIIELALEVANLPGQAASCQQAVTAANVIDIRGLVTKTRLVTKTLVTKTLVTQTVLETKLDKHEAGPR